MTTLAETAATLATMVLKNEYSDEQVDAAVGVYLRNRGPETAKMRKEIADAFEKKVGSLKKVQSSKVIERLRLTARIRKRILHELK
jgi:hypothetical protein